MRPEPELRDKLFLDLVGPTRMKELRAPVPDIEQPEEDRGDHSYKEEAAMMLGQGETDDRRYQSDRLASDSDHICVESAYPLLVNLE